MDIYHFKWIKVFGFLKNDESIFLHTVPSEWLINLISVSLDPATEKKRALLN